MGLDIRAVFIRGSLALATFFGLVVLAAILIALSPTLSRSVTAFFVAPQSGAVPWNGTDPVNIAIIGLDQRAGSTEFPHTDTIVVVSVNPATDSVHMLSIPRDLWVNIPGVGGTGQTSRINEAYGDGGTRLLIQTVEGVVNMPIRYYAIVKFTGFEKVIDAVGGVTIVVKHAIYDPTYPAFTGNGFAPLRIRAGVQHMNGKLALEYVRTRHDDPLGDLGRNQRQQQLLAALKQQVLTPATLLNLPALLGALQQAISTNFPYDDLTYLARLIMTAHPQHRFLNYANNSVSNYVTAGGADVLLPNWARIHWIAHQTFHNPQLRSSQLDVLNGSGIAGEASQLGQWMRACGFDVAAVTNADRSDYTQTEVIRNSSVGGGAFVARMAGDLLHAPVVTRAISGAQAPVVVIVGQNWMNLAQS
ncbi:MAG TPA: LCP family protein [Chloroflexota bacterium]|nr:LCP family protein [Chloroflexota bacterium]